MNKNRKGVVSAGDRLTAEAGAEILRAGGNAFDAVISATFMSFAASSSITSAGGGGFCLTHPVQGGSLLYDFFVQTPKLKRKRSELDFYPEIVDFGDKTQEFHIGFGAIATPGNVAGLFEVHKHHGSMPIQEIMAQVLDKMRKGIALHAQTKYQIDILTPILTTTGEGTKIYQKNGKALEIGDRYFLPDMVDFFEYLARNGPREFYEGEIAQKIAMLCIENGGHLMYEDLAQYEVYLRKPLSTTYRNKTVLTNPPPNSGGPLIVFLLKLIENIAFNKQDYGSARHLQTLADSIRLTDLTRSSKLDHIAFAKGDASQLFDQGLMDSLRQTLQHELHKSGNTTHVSVIDKEGNIASCTTSVGEGCGHFIPGTNIMLNNMLGEEDLNKQGFHLWTEDQRMSSMMSPTIVLSKEGSKMGLGSGGSNRIRSAIAQVIMNYVDFNLSPDEIVNNPRIHLENNHLDIEPGFSMDEIKKIRLPEGVEQFLWSNKNMYFGGVHAVFMDAKGNITGAGDRRRVGHVEYV